MKIKKFLSIILGIIQGMDSTYSYSADEAYNFILKLEAGLKEIGIQYNQEKKQDKQGLLHLKVVNKDGKGIPAEVKIFPINLIEDINNYNKINGKIEFTRINTYFNGEIEVNLSSNKNYLLEVSKGPEYEMVKKYIQIAQNQVMSQTVKLDRLINLQDEKWYPGDLHHHSIYSSPVHGGTDPVVETVEEVLNAMQATGLAYGALSDHHNIKNHEEWKAVESKEFIPILSKEISTTNGHVMALGVDSEVTYKIPIEEERSQKLLRNEFLRVAQEIKTLGGMPQINHPRETNPSIAFPVEFTDIIDIFETMEIWNGSNPMLKGTTNYEALRLWIELLNQGRYIPATTGSDTHNIKANDYNEIMEKLTWLIEESNKNINLFSEEVQDLLKYTVPNCKKVIGLVEKWAKENVGTGGVRTYVYVPEALTSKNILEGLRKGNSFLTNGPLLIPSIQERIPGQVINPTQDFVNIHIRLMSHKPLIYLKLYTDKGILYTIELETCEGKKKLYDYSRELMNVNLKDSKWIIFIAVSDHTNLVITNPIFIER